MQNTPDGLWTHRLCVLLQGSFPGLTIVSRDSCPSTSTLAKACAQGGGPEGLLVVTEHQCAGRGRQNKGWFSVPGKSLTFSLLLRPSHPPSQCLSLPLLGALSLAEGLEGLGLYPRLKWPNDLLLGEQKIAGILFESGVRGGRTEWVVLGIGVNVNLAEEDFPEALRNRSASLSMHMGKKLPRYVVLRSFLVTFWKNYSAWKKSPHFGAWKESYLSRLAWLDREVVVRWEGDSVRGRLRGVDEEGALVVETAEGNKRLYWGEASLLPAGWRRG